MIHNMVFVKKRWTEHAILDITHQMESNMDKVIHVWFKAFDTVDHSILFLRN